MTDRTVSCAYGTTIARVVWGAVLAYAVLLTYLLLAPHPLWLLGYPGRVIETAVDGTLSGYLQHGLAYAVLAWLLVLASRTGRGSWRVACVLLALAHGILAEWLQGFVPGRYSIWPDGLANVVGLAAGWVAASWILRAGRKPFGNLSRDC